MGDYGIAEGEFFVGPAAGAGGGGIVALGMGSCGGGKHGVVVVRVGVGRV